MANIMRLGGGGKKAEGEIPITANGIYDVAEYASANVNVQSAPVLLWTNASPTSEFAPQTVSVSGAEYDAYLVECKYGTTIDYRCISMVKKNVASSLSCTRADAGYSVMSRRVTSATSTAITFEAGYQATYVRNQYAIPTRIWGVKFTL